MQKFGSSIMHSQTYAVRELGEADSCVSLSKRPRDAFADLRRKTSSWNTFVVSADGKLITETDVTPAPSLSTMTVTLHKP
jgi:hypothetical protein